MNTKNMKYVLELVMSEKNSITEKGISDVCRGLNIERRDTPDGYIIYAPDFETMDGVFGRTMGTMELASFLKQGFYTGANTERHDCTESLIFEPESLDWRKERKRKI